MRVASGALIVRGLCSGYPGLSEILGGKDPIDSNAAKALVWAAAGLTYSYIASAPILTMHVSRMYLRNLTVRSMWFVLALAGSVILPFALGWLGCSYFHSQVGHRISWSILLMLTVAQTFYAWKMARDSDRLYDFYKRLSHNRTASGKAGDLIESYRHLREHGNSMLIVLFEIVLASVFWGIRPKTMGAHAEVIVPSIVVLMWIAPSSVAWFAGTIIERKFAKDLHPTTIYPK